MAIRNGTPDDDILHGTTGNDTINGYAGNDTIYGAGGTDIIDGGDGDDVVYLRDPPGDYGNILGGRGFDIIFFNTDSFVNFANDLSGFEKIVARGGSDNISLGETIENLAILGRGGDDRITGGHGNDSLIGGDGNDQIVGGEGNDFLNGGAGNDMLIGGLDRDVMTGGAGADRFRFIRSELADSFGGMSPSTAERITDFSQAERDRIVMNSPNGVPYLTFIGNAAFSGAAGELRYQQIGANTYVMGDINGDAAADFWIRLDGLHTLTAGDFVL